MSLNNLWLAGTTVAECNPGIVVETCGSDWRTSVVRGVARALAGGAAALVAGRAGRATCALRALRPAAALALPAACAAPHSLAAALGALASRLGWQRVLLPPDAACAHLEPLVAHELTSAGLAVRRNLLSRFEIDKRPHGNL